MSSESKPTLYERLGGVYSIAAVVDDFIDRVMHNPVLNANAAVDEAHHRVSAAGFKYYVTEMVCWATGGPQKYTGRSMSEAHKDLKISATFIVDDTMPPRDPNDDDDEEEEDEEDEERDDEPPVVREPEPDE